MNCEIIRNNTIVAGPMEFNAERVRDIVARQGGDYRLVPNGLTAAVNIGSISIKPVQVIKPVVDRMHELTSAERSESVDKVTYRHGTQAKDAEKVREQLTLDLSRIHQSHDMGNTSHRGVSIKTDLEARINAEAVLKEFEAGTMTITGWNGSDGQIPVHNTAEMKALRSAILNHVKAGFIAKDQVKTQIQNTSDSELINLDIRSEFSGVIAAFSSL